MMNAPLPPSEDTSKLPDACGAGEALVERTDGALRKLEKALAVEAGPALIHEARKSIKEYRALLRLVKSDEARQARQAAAAAARTLSATRDRQAARDAIADLTESGLIAPEDGERVRDAIGTNEAASSDAAAGIDTLTAWLEAARRLHAQVLNGQLRDANLARGLSEGYDNARKSAAWKTPDALHELRKRVVTHRYQMSFFARLHDGAGANRTRRAQRLRELLGAVQDIEALGQVLDGLPQPLDPALRQRIAAAGAIRQKQLVKDAKHLHRILFSHGAKLFVRRVKRRWRATDSAPAA